ncbi:hypothetical protein EC973_006039 [Apophysomyces ossiformis]|uniref:Uncharacterized protein n=1 Tax=Apophysomyces ossiformis TaxID=679940 RepID=A0A8H7ESK0_9FUNG|nr:hypothetical protein EC973_006039 [Apophysomyces ossiformis]
MSDLNWCTYCDKSISPLSNSLYCSQECLRADALHHHPMLGYDYAEFKDFPRSPPALSPSSTSSSSPSLSPIPSYTLPSPHLPLTPPPPAFELGAPLTSKSHRLPTFTLTPNKRSSIYF